MKRKGLAVGIILLFVGTGIIPAIAQDIEKSSLPTSSGNWLYVGGNGPGNYTRIQDAIDNASAGDIVFVYNGTYFENIRVTESIYLTGEDKNTTIIDGNLNGSAIITLTDGVTIRNFTIQDSDGIGIDVKSNYTKILGNVIRNNNWSGVEIFGVDQISRHDIFISGNTITNNNFRGIYLWRSDKTTITKNVISYNKRGGIYGSGFVYNTITENNISNNEHYCGISWYGSNDNTIFANTIKDNGGGIRIEGTSRTNITKNNLENNGINLYLSSNNLITKNNFYQHSATFSYEKYDNNIWKGNYWNKPRLLPKPIIGEIGYVSDRNYHPQGPWVNFDWHPAQGPYDIPGMR